MFFAFALLGKSDVHPSERLAGQYRKHLALVANARTIGASLADFSLGCLNRGLCGFGVQFVVPARVRLNGSTLF